MPAIRSHVSSNGIHNPETEGLNVRSYSNGLSIIRAELRILMDERLKQLTGNPKASMRWSEKGYAFGVVVRGRHRLVGWPAYANIAFGNLSDIGGGQPVLRFLRALWNVGILRFEPATNDEINLARRNPKAVLPGIPPTRLAPLCWGPYGRNDMGTSHGRGRFRPVGNPRGLPVRRHKRGPITPKLILDSDIEDASDEVESGTEDSLEWPGSGVFEQPAGE